MAGIARQVAVHGQPFAPPCVLLSGGETTVTVRGAGRGGRNVEFLLSLGIALDGHPAIHALAGDTDGVDGEDEIAGAYLDPDSLARAASLGIRPADRLSDNDGHGLPACGDAGRHRHRPAALHAARRARPDLAHGDDRCHREPGTISAVIVSPGRFRTVIASHARFSPSSRGPKSRGDPGS